MGQGPKFPRGYLKKLVLSEAGPPDECWLWPGYVTETGYGVYRSQRVHRAAYANRYGPIPDGLVIDHTCRQRSCFNPDHLKAVTQAVNSRRTIQGPRGPNKYPLGYLKALVTSEAGPPESCWIWPGSVRHGGYGYVGVGGRTVMAHRASYEAHYGKIAADLEVDHMCHQPSCFNYRHLRAVSRAVNARNKRRFKNNTSGYTGVNWNVATQKWRVLISIDGKQQSFGYYGTKEEAVEVAKEARRQLGYTY